MVKVVDFKDRAIERLGQFRDTPRLLPTLVHARYANNPATGHVGPARAQPLNFALRKHKPHQMHAQHRENIVLVLQWLVKKLDIVTRECVFVNPRFNIRRPPYVPEMARHLNLSDRTITRCLGSLTRSRYLFRSAKRYFLSDRLFRDLSLEVELKRLVGNLQGLKKRNEARANPKQPAKQHAQPIGPAYQVVTAVPHSDTVNLDRSVGQSHLDKLRRGLKGLPRGPG